MSRRWMWSIRAAIGFVVLFDAAGPVRRAEAAPCDAFPRLPVATIDAAAQQVVLEVTAAADCDWRLDAWAPFTLPARRHWWGPRQVTIDVTANPSLSPRIALFSVGGRDVRLVQAGGTDRDSDGVSDAWELWWGLPVGSSSEPEVRDHDGDGVSTLEEAHADTHPNARATDSFWFAEGASTSLLQTTYAFVSVAPEPVTLVLTFVGRDGVLLRWPVRLQPEWPVYLDAARFAALDGREFAVAVEASASQVAAERVVSVTGGGQQAAPASYARRAGTSTDWYFAEGTTRAGFQLFYVLANTSSQAAQLEVTYFFPDGRSPLTRTRRLAPLARDVIWVNTEASELGATDVAAHLHSDHPVVVERTQFLQRPNGAWTAATAAAAQPAPATHWVFAEGATGPFFDTFFAFLNPSDAPVTVTATYDTDSAPYSVLRSYVLAPRSRTTLRVDDDADLASLSFGARFVADGPVAAERAMWWPGDFPTWYEGHSSPGQAPALSQRLRFAAPLVEFAPGAESYLLSWSGYQPPSAFIDWEVRCENGARFSAHAPNNLGRQTYWLSFLRDYEPALAGRCAMLLDVRERPPSCPPVFPTCDQDFGVEVATYGDAGGRVFGRGTVRWLQLIEP